MFSGIGVPQRDDDPEYDHNLNTISDEEAEIEAEARRYFAENGDDAMEVDNDEEYDAPAASSQDMQPNEEEEAYVQEEEEEEEEDDSKWYSRNRAQKRRIAETPPGTPEPSASPSQQRIHSEHVDYDDATEDNRPRAAADGESHTAVDASVFSDFRAQHFGDGIQSNPPIFRQGVTSNSTWSSYAECGSSVRNMRPVRSMCWNIPAELFARDGQRFRHWSTPNDNMHRAAQIAAILGMAFTPTSKGFMSGNHEELQRTNTTEDSEETEQSKQQKVGRVYRYAFMLPRDNNVTAPMFVIAYQELYNTELTEVTAIRVWKFVRCARTLTHSLHTPYSLSAMQLGICAHCSQVFDDAHSDSELWRKLMEENNITYHNGGCAHHQNITRRKSLVTEHKQHRIVSGGLHGRYNLESFCATQYVRCVDETQQIEMLKAYGGKSMHDDGLPCVNYEAMPRGVTTTRIDSSSNGMGGTHPLSPEYTFNARRQMALQAGLVDFSGKRIDVHPDYIDPSKYFSDRGDFTVPDVDLRSDGFFFCTATSVTNIFDTSLPRSIYGSVCAGKHILSLYKDENPDDPMLSGSSKATLSDCFTQMMTAKDREQLAMERQMAETVIAYDSIDTTEFDRKGLAHYGQMDPKTNAYIIEPRQIMKEIQQQTRRVTELLIEPWKLKREEAACQLNDKIRKSEGPDSDLMNCDYFDDRLEELHKFEGKTQEKYCKVQKDLIYLHIQRIEAAFMSKMERSTIPPGYNAMFDGLKAELEKSTNHSACCAFTYDRSITADDISIFAHIHMWIGQFFEQDCFIEGRDRRIMDEIFLQMFEQYGDVTFLLLLCGYKGNGKTLRTERATYVFPPDWVVAGGPSSAKGGMNGDHSDTNGKNVIYDEMIDDLCDADGSDRLEFWKQIVLKREYIYQRTVSVKSADGNETMKTMKLKTPHDETHTICTNYGMAFTKDRDPSDTKFAMIDRSIAHMVRSIGTKAHTDNEFRQHMSKPDQQRKLSIFRTFVCLVGATKLVIKGVPAFQPNLALANKIFDYLDNKMIVGEYNLPRRTPRKSLKREENLRTMTVMNAVGKVFMYKQTAVEFDAGRIDAGGELRPFQWTQLYDVIRQLVPTPELIFIAWSQSLDYNIGTASHTFAAMTSVCEVFGLKVENWMKKPPSGKVDDMVDVIEHSGGSPSQTFSRNGFEKPKRTDFDTEVEYDNACKAWLRGQSDKCLGTKKFETLPSILNTNGLTKENAKELLTAMERQRRATSAYRHRCAIEGNSQLKISNPVETIERIMEKVPPPLDAPPSSSTGGGDYMPLYSSCIMANTVQVSTLHKTQSIAKWMTGDVADSSGFGCASIGTAPGFNFSKRKSRGAVVWNTAWMRHPTEVTGWMGFARDVISGTASRKCNTVKIFDLPINGFRDLAFLLSTRDNSRRCTEDPDMKEAHSQNEAFTKHGTSEAVGEDKENFTVLTIGMRGIRDSRGYEKTVMPEERARHPYAGIPNEEIQRRIDSALLKGRFPAMSPTFSNKVTDGAPLRLVSGDGDKKYVELNTSAALEHTKMMAEGVLRCSLHPGMQNTMERFCDDAGGPAEFTLPGNTDAVHENITKLSYSYDIMTIALTLDAMSRFYDPHGREYCSMYRESYKELKLNVPFEDLPHMSMRFVGLKEESDRRLLSFKTAETRSEAFPYIEAGENLDLESIEDARAMVSVNLGHHATDDEVLRYLKSRAGSRSMSGVDGDLMSMETWLKHSMTVLKERGMVSGDLDVVMQMAVDEPYQLRTRVTEAASRDINKLVDKHPRMKGADKPEKGDDKLAVEQLKKTKEDRRRRIRNELYNTMPLPDHLEKLRHCGPLQIIEPPNKRTYHNAIKSKKRPHAEQANVPKAYSTASAVQSQNGIKRVLKQGLPNSHQPVKSRGAQDSRMRV